LGPFGGDAMTYSQAVARAKQLAKKNDRDYFVVEQIKGEIDVVDDRTLDSFYSGISERAILFCTGDL
jgi:hypothetical protein